MSLAILAHLGQQLSSSAISFCPVRKCEKISVLRDSNLCSHPLNLSLLAGIQIAVIGRCSQRDSSLFRLPCRCRFSAPISDRHAAPAPDLLTGLLTLRASILISDSVLRAWESSPADLQSPAGILSVLAPISARCSCWRAGASFACTSTELSCIDSLSR
jgi:hypothetical protein